MNRRSAIRERNQRIRTRRREREAARASSNRPSGLNDMAAFSPPPIFTDETGSPLVAADGRPLHLDGLARGGCLFLVLSGPSIRSLDLSLLNQRGIATMGVNNSPSIFRPNYWTYVDRANKFHDAIWRDPAIMKIMPDRHFHKPLRTKTADGFSELIDRNGGLVQAGQMPGVIGYRRNATFNPDTWLTEPTVNWGNSKKSANRNNMTRCLNVMFVAVRLAYLLGFRKVFLLGCDFRMDEQRPYAFDQVKSSGGVSSNNNCYRVLNEMFAMLRPKFDAAGFQVFNCNPASGLTVFDHLSYISAIQVAIEGVPQDPIKTDGWYE